MGGAVSAVTDAVESVGSAVGDAVEGTVDAVKDIGSSIDDNIIHPVAKAVDNTVQAAMDDPVNTAIRVAAVASGQWWALPLAEATITVAQGGDLEEAATRAATAAALQQAGAAVGAEAGAAATEAGATAEQAAIAKGVAAGTTRAGLAGGDMEQGAIMGGLGAGTGIAAQELSDQQFADAMQKQAADAYENSYSPTEQDVLAADSSIKMDFPLETPADQSVPGYFNEETGEYIPSEYGQYSAPLDNTSGTNPMEGYDYNPDTKTWTTPDGQTYNMDYLQSSGQPVSGSDILEAPTERAPEGYDPLLTKNEMKAGMDFATKAILAGDQQANRLAGIKARANQTCAAMGGFDMSVPWLSTKEQMLRNKLPVGDESGTGIKAGQAELDNIYKSITPELSKEFADRGIGMGAHTVGEATPRITGLGDVMHFASAGTVDSTGSSCSGFCSTWGAMGKYVPKFYPTSSGMLQAGGKKQAPALNPLKQIQSHISNAGNMGGMARGGLPAKYQEAAPDGHNPEFVTGLTGYYACGGGTGQSDDIPAMLHDGDYVMDADVVAALGDGSSKAGKEVLSGFLHKVPHKDTASGKPVPAKIADGEFVFPEGFVTALGGGDNKAGAKILDGMREKLRAHKRSAPTSKIPPKAKSPLDYIKGTKG